MNEITLVGRAVRLRALGGKDLEKLFEWRNDLGSLYLFNNDKVPVTFEIFREQLNREYPGKIHVLLMIELIRTGEAIGFVTSHDVQFVDGYAFVGTFIDQKFRSVGYGAEASALFLDYLFTYFSFRKIYTDVYVYNDNSQGCLMGAGFVEEGRFKDHRFYDGGYHDLVRYAIYRDRLEVVAKLARQQHK